MTTTPASAPAIDYSKTFFCDRCGVTFQSYTPGSSVSNFAYTRDNRMVCVKCCAELEKAYMRTHDKIVLYFQSFQHRYQTDYTRKNKIYIIGGHGDVMGELTDAMGNKIVDLYYIDRGKHNIAGRRYDFRFMFEGRTWHGTVYGDNSDLAYCRRLKK